MYREDGWMEGHYIDNHKKYECLDCGSQFIVGEELEKNCPPGFPVCPYCGQSNVECVVSTEDEELAICVNVEDMYRRRLTPQERTRQQVYATGNKWSIENFRDTHN